jgi:hypothetical protein
VIGHQHVDVAERRHGGVDDPLGSRGVGEVGGLVSRPPPQRPQLRQQGLGAGLVRPPGHRAVVGGPGVQDDVGASRGNAAGDGRTDPGAAAGPGDQHDPFP